MKRQLCFTNNEPWKRSPLLIPQGPLIMIVNDVVYTILNTNDHWGPEIRIYGVTLQGNSVVACVRDFYPYFFIRKTHSFSARDVRVNLDQLLEKHDWSRAMGGVPRKGFRFVIKVEEVSGYSIMGYENQASTFLKITLSSPQYIRFARKSFEYSRLFKQYIQTYEANVDFVVRFMVDAGISGMQWIKILQYRFLGENEFTTQLALETPSYYIQPIPTTEMGQITGIRILAFDGEMCKIEGRGFVDPLNDPITQWAHVLKEEGKGILDRVVFCLLPRKDANVGDMPLVSESGPEIRTLKFHSEEEMLKSIARYIAESDVDIFTGYNISGFDWPYLFKRATALNILNFGQFTRYSKSLAVARQSKFESKAYGARKDYQLYCEGRWSFDMLTHIRRALKLRSYTLGNVTQTLLEGDTKVDMPYELIPEYQNGTDDQRAHLAYYCWKDAELCFTLMNQQMALVNGAEQARVTGVPMKYLLSRGQQIKTFSKLLRVARLNQLFIPSSTESENEDHTQGATVLEPKRGLYRCPIVVLDFKSLYPTIMIAYNICYCTKIPLKVARQLFTPDQYNVPPILGCKYAFLTREVKEGILPKMLADFLNARSKAKSDLKKETDPDRKAVLDGRQLALKVVCNSVYGFVKANMVCDKDLMEAVTAWGRALIEQTKELIESKYEGSEVVYGDTDSVMVKFGDNVTPEEAQRLGTEAAELCNQIYREPIELEYEKLYHPYLLISKKKYAGFKLEQGYWKLASSGLDNVRRDNCKLASETLQTVLEMILVGDNVDLAISFVHQTVAALLRGEIDMSQLIISKSLSKTFEHYDDSGTKQVHVELAKRITNRAHITGEQIPVTGDRIKYVMIAKTSRHQTSECSEDPLYALQHKLPIDVNYYINKQLRNMLCKIFTPILAPKEVTFKFQKSGKHKGARKTLSDKEWHALTAYKKLFTGSHMQHVVKKLDTSNEGLKMSGSLLGFVQIAPKCLGSCGSRLSREATTGLCSACEPQRLELQQQYQQSFERIKNRRDQVWADCRACAGTDDAACTNKDCDMFFHRQQIIMDVEDLGEKLKRLI